MVRKTVEIANPMGLHLRPAGKLCETAVRYKCKITLEYNKDGKTGSANAKSVLGILAACIGQGEEITLCCDGPDEKEAIEDLTQLIAAL